MIKNGCKDASYSDQWHAEKPRLVDRRACTLTLARLVAVLGNCVSGIQCTSSLCLRFFLGIFCWSVCSGTGAHKEAAAGTGGHEGLRGSGTFLKRRIKHGIDCGKTKQEVISFHILVMLMTQHLKSPMKFCENSDVGCIELGVHKSNPCLVSKVLLRSSIHQTDFRATVV